MISKIYSVTLAGLQGHSIEIETDITRWLPTCTIVGLPDTAVQESKERVRSAIKNSGFEFPTKRITINLAPADIRKRWPSFDLAIALGILAHEQMFSPKIMNTSLFLGELALDGSLRSTNAILPSTVFAKISGYTHIFVPRENTEEAALVPGIYVIGVTSLKQCVEMLCGKTPLIPQLPTDISKYHNTLSGSSDFWDIIGQDHAKRALIIAATGGHNIIMEWPPGSGKTMLARALSSILPDLSYDELIEISQIYSIAGLLSKYQPLIHTRPFRYIHHTASAVSIIGWGRESRPGEISLAHKGVLFLDELLEFPSHVLETLRQPLEDGKITINRAHASYTYPSFFMLVGAFNPTPCGYSVDDPRNTSTTHQVERYRSKLSGPLLDRIDLFIHVPKIAPVDISNTRSTPPESSASLKKKVNALRTIQSERFTGESISCNAHMTNTHIKKYCALDPASERFLLYATEKLELSTRAYFRILKVARTIADMSQSEHIKQEHIAEALGYRRREGGGI